MNDVNEKIETIYEDNNFPGAEKLYKLVVKEHPDITRSDIVKFLKQQKEEQLLKIKKKPSQLGHITASKVNEIWQVDYFIMRKFQEFNKGYSYILAVVDVFSRKAYAIPLKIKDATTTINAFQDLMKQNDVSPIVMMTDQDGTFLSNEFQKYLEKNEIILEMNVLNDHFALGIIDNFARRLKTIFSKIFIRTGKKNWIDYIDKVVSQYNKTPHSALKGLSPNQAEMKEHEEAIAIINQEKKQHNKVVSDLEIGDKVRKRIMTQFNKASEQTFSEQVYEVVKIQGNTIYLNDGTKMKRNNLLKV